MEAQCSSAHHMVNPVTAASSLTIANACLLSPWEYFSIPAVSAENRFARQQKPFTITAQTRGKTSRAQERWPNPLTLLSERQDDWAADCYLRGRSRSSCSLEDFTSPWLSLARGACGFANSHLGQKFPLNLIKPTSDSHNCVLLGERREAGVTRIRLNVIFGGWYHLTLLCCGKESRLSHLSHAIVGSFSLYPKIQEPIYITIFLLLMPFPSACRRQAEESHK